MKGLFALLLCVVSWAVQADSAQFKASLDHEQRQWLETHQEIRVGAMDGWPPMNFVDYRQRPQGIGADLVEAMNQRLDGRLKIVSGPWNEIYEKTQRGELDALLDITPKPEREAFFNFTKPYLHIPHVIVARRDTPYLADLAALAGKTVALEANIGTVAYLKDNFPLIDIREYRDTSHCLEAVNRGEADAYVGNRAVADYLISQELLQNLKIHGRDNTRSGSVLALGTPKSNSILRDILQRALDDIDTQEFNTILSHWSGTQMEDVKLSAEESAWIAEQNEVLVGGETDWPPFDFVGEDGRYQGISRDIMELVSSKTGLKLRYVTGATWSDMVASFKSGELDILPAMYKSASRAQFTEFTAPYFEVKDYAFMRSDAVVPGSLEELAKLRVAAIDGYQIIENLSKRFPGIELVKVKSLQQGLDAVLLGNADAYIDGYAVVKYQLARSMQTGLKPVLPVDFYTNTLHVGVGKGRPLLASIVQKGVASITEEEKNAIFLKWFGEQPSGGVGKEVTLSTQERNFLEQHQTIRVHYDTNWPPFSFDDSGQPAGLAVSLIDLIAEKSGMRVEYVSTGTWAEAQAGARDGTIDLLLNVSPSAERAEYLNFTEPFISALRGIVMREGEPAVTRFDELLGKTIALPRGFYYTEYFQKHYPDVKLYLVDNDVEALQAVAYGQADLTMGVLAAYQYLMGRNYITNLKIVGLPASELFKPSPLTIAARKSAPELISILNKGMASISVDEMRALTQLWLGESNSYPDPQELEALNLTRGEKEWLRNHAVIRYSEVDWKPLSIIDNGKMTGIMGEYLGLVGKRTGLQFQYVPSKSWPDVLEQLKEGIIDLVPGSGDSPQERAMGLLSDRFASYPMVIVTNSDIPYVRSLDEVADRTFAVPKGYTSYNYLKQVLPGARVIATRDIPEALSLVSSGKADLSIGHLAPAIHYMGQMSGGELRIAGNTDFQFNHHFLISNRYPELLSIVNKVFATLTEKEREQFYHDWVQVEVQQGVDYSLFWKAAVVVVALALVMIYWNRLLKSRVRRATARLTALLESFDQHVIASKTDLAGNITYASNAFCAITGFRRDELMGQNHRLIKHPDNDPDLYRGLWATIEKGETWRGELKNRRKDGSHFWADAIVQPEYDLNGTHIGYSAIRQDITAQKEVEELSSSLEQKVEERTEELRESREYLAEVLDSQPSIVLTTDGRRLRSVNKAFLRFYGLESLEQFAHECICDTFESREGENYLQSEVGEYRWIEYVRLNPDTNHVACIGGNLFTVSATELDIGDEVLYLAVLTDITQLQAAQEALNRSRRLMHDLIDNTDAVIYVMDLSGNYLLVNRGWREVFGMDCEVVGLDSAVDSLKPLYDLDDLDSLPQEYKELTVREVVVPVDDRDNIFLSYRFPLHDHRGRLYATAGVAINITDRKETERQLEAFNRKISDSIEYGSLIQNALLPEPRLMQEFFDEHFAIWEPKDVVGGDIYLFDPIRNEEEALLMVIDCTGHGVPGAFMTMLVKAVERGIVSDLRSGDQDVHPAEILQRLNRTIRTMLRQDNPDSASNAGLDGAVLYFDKARDILRFSGAETPLFYFERTGELKTINGDRHGIGYRRSDPNYVFTEHQFKLSDLHSLLVTTDGFVDQNGGSKGFPLGKRRLKELLQENRERPVGEMPELLMNTLDSWQQGHERSDDLTLVGVGFHHRS